MTTTMMLPAEWCQSGAGDEHAGDEHVNGKRNQALGGTSIETTWEDQQPTIRSMLSSKLSVSVRG